MRTVFHIGHQKTGTTFLQQVYFARHPEICLVDRKTAHAKLVRQDALRFKPEVVQDWLVDQWERSGRRKIVVVSDEELSGHVYTGGGGGFVVKELADRIFAVSPNARIVVGIRSQLDMIESVYRQYVRDGGTFSLRRFLFDPWRHKHFLPQFSFDHLEYKPTIEYYHKLFGRQHVDVVLYEDLKANPSSFLSELSQKLGIHASVGDAESRSVVHPRLSRVSVALLRGTNHFFGRTPVCRRCIIDVPKSNKLARRVATRLDQLGVVQRLDRGHTFIDGETRAILVERFSESNRELSDLLRRDLFSCGYPGARESTRRSGNTS